MTRMELIELDEGRADWLPYAPAVKVPSGSEYVFLSGAVGADDDGVFPDDIAEQTRIVMRRHTESLAANGLTWDDVLHVYDFLTDMRDFVEVFTVMDEFTQASGAAWRHANTLIGVNGLSHPSARVEFDVIAVRPATSSS
ncbi:RidA family protein [Microbacterium sp. NPDC058389]|uniref:RidA family protein n=1 Tax=Microbacterium sp. NPDC058389 TaxID=3346475 RepID=UPI0036540F5F